jgi:hypothetical protein
MQVYENMVKAIRPREDLKIISKQLCVCMSAADGRNLEGVCWIMLGREYNFILSKS